MKTILLVQNEAISCTSEQMLAWQCQFDYNKLVGIKGSKDGWYDPTVANDPNLFVADIFLAATFFIGTIAFLWIIISWLKMIFQWWQDSKKAADAIKWIKYSLIGLIIVVFSYTIIRVIQYFVWWKI